jgi:hypothetical protein
MALPKQFKNAQSQSGRAVVPVAFTYLDAGNYGDSAAPGIFHPLLLDVDGNLFVSIGGSGGPIAIPDDSDAVAEVATDTRIPTVARLYGFNPGTSAYDRIRTDDDADDSSPDDGLPALRVMGRNRLFVDAFASWSRERGIDGIAVAPSASRTVTTTFGTFTNTNWRASHFVVDVTVIGADDLTIEIQGRQLFPPFDFYPLLTGLPIAATGTTVFKIGIGFSPILNLTANDLIPAVFQVVATPSGADPITYSINANLSV